MKEKITLENIIPFLHHKVKCSYLSDGKRVNAFITGIEDLDSIITTYLRKKRNSYSFNYIYGDTISFNGRNNLSDLEFKLHLYPLSYIIKEINVNGKTLVPSEFFEIGDNINNSEEYDYGNIKLIKKLKDIAIHNIHHDIQFLPHGVVKKLYEWHIDVDNLIGKNLASVLKYDPRRIH